MFISFALFIEMQSERQLFTLHFVKSYHSTNFAEHKHTKQKEMEVTTFVISDESVNSYGYIVKTDGIDTTEFERNPVMLYMHERKTVVGRWDNIRKDGKRLLADAVFDESSDLGVRVKKQVEGGFLRSASIGIDILEETTIDGIKTVTKSELLEVSIVDIPANKNALKLYQKGNRKRLALAFTEKVEDLRESILNLLGLDDDATDEDIMAEIQNLLNAPDNATLEVEEAIKAGYVGIKDRGNFIRMARLDRGVYRSFITGEKDKRKRAVKTAIDGAISDGRINFSHREIYAYIGESLGLETLGQLLATRSRPVRPTELIDGGDRSKWTLADYRKYRPDDLKNNPKLYAALVEVENDAKQKVTGGKKSLEYYRRHNPEYFKDHPEEYEKLLATI